MASSFKNAGLDVGVLDDATGNMYTAGGTAHAVSLLFGFIPVVIC